jgi:hypothetical protein
MGWRSIATNWVTMLLTSKPLPTPGDEMVAMAFSCFRLRCFGTDLADLSEISHAQCSGERWGARHAETPPRRRLQAPPVR